MAIRFPNVKYWLRAGDVLGNGSLQVIDAITSTITITIAIARPGPIGRA
jgi:hypothetical protein